MAPLAGQGVAAMLLAGVIENAVTGTSTQLTTNYITHQTITDGLTETILQSAMWSVAGGGAVGLVGKAAARLISSNAIGKVGEEAAGISLPKVQIRTVNGTAPFRVPDEVDLIAKSLREVKNVAELSYTRQLRDYAAWAERRGFTFRLVTRQNTKLSGPLQEAIDAGKIVWEQLPW